MLHLYLIRHAKSSWESPGLRDFDRPLNDRGLEIAPRMAQLLVGAGLRPDLLVSSPAKRALTTAQIFAKALGLPDDAVVRNPGIYEAYATDLLRIISELPAEARSVCLFGHNPTLTDLANRFSEKRIDNVPTCGVVQIESSANSWSELYEANAAVKALYFPKTVL